MFIRSKRSTWLFLFLFVLFLSACSGPMVAEDADSEEAEEVAEPEAVNLAAYEDFDVAPYREESPVTDRDLEHDVPAELMEGRADRGASQQVEGFRIQIYSSQERSNAEDVEEDVRNWWDQLGEDRPSHLFRGDLPVYITYRQPYYRVRIGDFASRERAQEALEYLRSEFGDAFISPDTVTITR